MLIAALALLYLFLNQQKGEKRCLTTFISSLLRNEPCRIFAHRNYRQDLPLAKIAAV
jgi:hypothetical protein